MPTAIQKIEQKTDQKIDNCYLITAAAVQATLKFEHFDPVYLTQLPATRQQSNGRATVWFFNISEADQAVLRHYHRGGVAAKFSSDQFLWTGINRTRAVAEYRLSEWMYSQGLPVTEPLGARVQRHGIYYTCDLITRLHPNSKTLAQLLADTTEENVWYETGNAIGKIHQLNIWHSDLNAHNILIDKHNQVKLIDFDRCKRRSGQRWKAQNLDRLRRSLNKLQRQKEIQHVKDSMWQTLLNGYSLSSTRGGSTRGGSTRGGSIKGNNSSR